MTDFFWFAKHAIRRAETETGVFVSNGHWLLFVPSEEYPNDFTRFTAERENENFTWKDGWASAPMCTDTTIMPLPAGSTAEGLIECVPEKRHEYWVQLIGTWGSKVRPFLYGDKPAAFDERYWRKLDRAGFSIYAAADQDPDKPFPVVRRDQNVVAGAIMGVRVEGPPK